MELTPEQTKEIFARWDKAMPLLRKLAATNDGFVDEATGTALINYLSPILAFPQAFRAPAKGKRQRAASAGFGPDRDVLTSMRIIQKYGPATAAFQAVLIEKFIHRATDTSPKAGHRINGRGQFTYPLSDRQNGDVDSYSALYLTHYSLFCKIALCHDKPG